MSIVIGEFEVINEPDASPAVPNFPVLCVTFNVPPASEAKCTSWESNFLKRPFQSG